jgi:hypothetical protein
MFSGRPVASVRPQESPAMLRRPRRPARVGIERLEDRLALAAGIDPVEVYSWQLINTMRADPAGFAADIQALHDGAPGTYHGYSASDPVWTDIRKEIDQGQGENGWSLAATLSFLRAQPKLPAYLLQEDLTTAAFDHTEWMKAHGFAHTGTTTLGSALPAFAATAAGMPDRFDHDATKYALTSGENINYGYNSDWAFEAPYKAGTLGRDAYLQRLAYYSTMTYILDVGLPDLGHLRNLLGRPDGVAGTSGNLAIANLDSIGIDESFQSYQQDVDVPNYYISTQRFDNVRDDGPKPGQYSGLTFADANQNGLYDVGESYQLTTGQASPVAPPSAPIATTPTPIALAATSIPGPVATAPHVMGLAAIRSPKKGLTAVVVAFDGAMDARSAASLAAYQLATTGKGRKFHPKTVRLARAGFDPTANTVTLALARPYKAAIALRLTISPAGLFGSNGLALAGGFSAVVPKW